jgi:predicted GNAT family acetyltransferase
MFICSNLKAAGIVYNGAAFEGEYFGCFDKEDQLLGVIVHYSNGKIIMHASNNMGLKQLTLHLKKYIHRAVSGVLGPATQASYVIKELELPGSCFRINSCERLYELCLSDLKDSAIPNNCNITPAHNVPKDILIKWMIDYQVEALGAINDDKLSKQVNKHISHLSSNDCFVLVKNGAPVSLVNFNARLEDMLQIAPVWTPVKCRNNGFARLLLANTLLQEKAKGIKKAILFASNPAAIRVYHAVGFKNIGDYRIALLKKPIEL